MSEADDKPHEIIIVRRHHGGDHDEPHGGVWKVAFADFMTAMMAFFLVLWIVNSTSKETRASVARYFNPVKLSDTTPARKGLQEPREDEFDASSKPPKPAPEAKPVDDKAPAVAAPAGKAGEAGQGLAGAPQTTPAPLADAWRDPFVAVAPPAPTSPPSTPPPPPGATAEGAARANAIKAEIASAIRDGAGPAVDVRETAEGTLISLTDRAGYGMFAVGSAEPNASMLQLMAQLGGALKAGRETIVVRGFTDARKFRVLGRDNWRLSAARAQAAFDMLVRGGLDERRVDRIEGYADRRPRNAADPEAAENRRIEILLRREGA